MKALRSVSVAAVFAAGIGVTACSDATDDSTAETTLAPSEAHTGSAWSYSGETSPESWGGLDGYETCATGTEQSPIDLAETIDIDLTDPEFDYTAGAFALENNGHTVQTVFAGDNSMTVDGTTYRLLQMHFHTPSEHEVDGAGAPAEFHLVHEADDGRLAVAGVLITEGDENPLLTASLADYPTDEGRATGSIDVDPGDILPSEHTTFRYDGSLTTPPCSEGIAWFVMTEPVTASADQISSLEALFGANNRPVQPLNDRTVERDTGG